MKVYERILAALALVLAASAASAELIPIRAWIHDPVIDSVNVSPDGNRLVALTLSDVNDAADITIWDTRDLGKPPKRFKPEETKALFVTWLSNDQLFVRGRQKYDFKVGSKTTKWFRDIAYLVDAETGRFRTLFKAKEDDVVQVNLFDTLPLEPDKILVETINLEFAPRYLRGQPQEPEFAGTARSSVARPARAYFTNPKGEIMAPVGDSSDRWARRSNRVFISSPRDGRLGSRTTHCWPRIAKACSPQASTCRSAAPSTWSTTPAATRVRHPHSTT